jgi:putative ABC transport system ATP-binding protein
MNALTSKQPIIDAAGIAYDVQTGGRTLSILRGVSLTVAPAEVVAIVGPSGSGKTSLLMLLAGLERLSGGHITINGQELSALGQDELARFRRRTLGIVFQSFHLIPSLSALDNVGLALEIASPRLSVAEVHAAAAAALDSVGLGQRLHHLPSVLSGGEQQRVAIARALVANPPLLLADEPTGNLDQKTGGIVADLLFKLARQHGTAVVLITHDPGLAAKADRSLTMAQGQLSQSATVG